MSSREETGVGYLWQAIQQDLQRTFLVQYSACIKPQHNKIMCVPAISYCHKSCYAWAFGVTTSKEFRVYRASCSKPKIMPTVSNPSRLQNGPYRIAPNFHSKKFLWLDIQSRKYLSQKFRKVNGYAMGMGLPRMITKFFPRKFIFAWFSTFLQNFWPRKAGAIR